MIVYVLFVHKKSVSKRKVCIIFIRNKKIVKKPQKKTFLVGFLGGFFGWVLYCQPCNKVLDWWLVPAATAARWVVTRHGRKKSRVAASPLRRAGVAVRYRRTLTSVGLSQQENVEARSMTAA
jgi:hypothetical protein